MMLAEDENGNFIEVGYISPFTGECSDSNSKPPSRKKQMMINNSEDIILGMAIEVNKLIAECKILRQAIINNKETIEAEFKLIHKRIDKLNES